MWDAETGTEAVCLRGHQPVSGAERLWRDVYQDGVKSLAFSPDGRRIVSGSYDRSVRLWDWTSGSELACLNGHESGVTAAAFSPDGRHMVSASEDETLRLWEAVPSVPLTPRHSHSARLTHLCFSPDARVLVSGSADGTVQVWDTASAIRLAFYPGSDSYRKVLAISPDARRIAFASEDQKIRVWEVAGAVELSCLADEVHAWPAEGNNPATLYPEAYYSDIVQRDVIGIWFSADGESVLTLTRDGDIRIWDARTGGRLAHFPKPDAEIQEGELSLGGRRVVFGSYDRAAWLWDKQGAECLKITEDESRSAGIDKLLAATGYLPWGAATSAFRCRTVEGDSETVVLATAAGQPVAWFPAPLEPIVKKMAGRMWAGVHLNQLYLFVLEGEETGNGSLFKGANDPTSAAGAGGGGTGQHPR